VLIRRERAQDAVRIRAVVAAAFAGRGPLDRLPMEVTLVESLRADPGWLPQLSLVAIDPRDDFIDDDFGYGEGDGETSSADDDGDPRRAPVRRTHDDDMVVGYVACSRAYVDGHPGLGLGPLAVRPERQRQGVGQALMHAVLGMADGVGESFVGLLGSPSYYRRFGFRPSIELGIEAPDPSWGASFQIRPLGAFRPITGVFSFATPFTSLPMA
jgi:putative acetyltransferase